MARGGGEFLADLPRAPPRNPLRAVSRGKGKGKGKKKGMGKGNEKGDRKRFLGTHACPEEVPQGAPFLGAQASCLQGWGAGSPTCGTDRRPRCHSERQRGIPFARYPAVGRVPAGCSRS
ncbi:MAG: hypothetical protein D6679_09945 [Candidatus Hydrogenedentota bacterium]|nr:MAG: hypothetical protein D6679_09945 [Candidatus Hydrogenedentota bacterium]